MEQELYRVKVSGVKRPGVIGHSSTKTGIWRLNSGKLTLKIWCLFGAFFFFLN